MHAFEKIFPEIYSLEKFNLNLIHLNNNNNGFLSVSLHQMLFVGRRARSTLLPTQIANDYLQLTDTILSLIRSMRKTILLLLLLYIYSIL